MWSGSKVSPKALKYYRPSLMDKMVNLETHSAFRDEKKRKNNRKSSVVFLSAVNVHK